MGQGQAGVVEQNPRSPKLSLSVHYLLLVLPGTLHHLLCRGCAGWLEVLPAAAPPAPAPAPGAEPLGEFCAGTKPAGWKPKGTTTLSTTATPRGWCGGQRDRLETRSQGLTHLDLPGFIPVQREELLTQASNPSHVPPS